VPVLLPILETLLKLFGIAFRSFRDALLMLSMPVKRRTFKVFLIFGNKLHGAISGEYGGWGMTTVLFFAEK
jgi:hypothetical protein